MKIFQIGFNRCGTTSIYSFFNSNCEKKLKCLHWERGGLASNIFSNLVNKKPLLDGKYENYNVYTDMQAFIKKPDGKMILFLAHIDCYKLLDDQYPNSKFILNTRSVENWIASRIVHYGERDMRLMEEIYNTKDILKVWGQQWSNHHNDVVNYFAKKNNLLIFNIEKDSGKKIANFFPELKFKSDEFPKIRSLDQKNSKY